MKRKAILAALALSGIMVATPVFAQSSNGGQGGGQGNGQGSNNQGGPGPRGPVAALVCSTTDYTEVVAKALGMTATELRVALVSGKRIQDIATSKNVTVDTILQAVETARKTDLDQAVKDGLLTQAQADAILQRQNRMGNMGNMGNGPANNQNNPQATPDALGTQAAPDNNQPGNPPQGQPGGQGQQGAMGPGPRGGFGRFGGFGLGVSPYNRIDDVNVVAKALGITCADLVKAVQSGKTISQLATDKNVTTQAIADALVAAHKDALAKDVKEGLITQAQADGEIATLKDRITAMVDHGFIGGPGMGRGRGGFGGFGPGGQNGPQNNPQNGNAPDGAATPDGTPQ